MKKIIFEPSCCNAMDLLWRRTLVHFVRFSSFSKAKKILLSLSVFVLICQSVSAQQPKRQRGGEIGRAHV